MGNKIVNRREELGITQAELARECGITQSAMCDIEKCRCKPSIETALKIASALDVKDINFFNQ